MSIPETIDDQQASPVRSRTDFAAALGKAIQCRQAVVTYPRRDYYRFPPTGPRWLMEFVTLARLALRRAGLTSNSPDFVRLSNNLNRILARLDDYAAVYDDFADDESRELFIELLAYRTLGPWFVRLSIDNEDFWKLYDSVNPRFRIRKNVSRYDIWNFHAYRMPAQTGHIELTCNELSIFRTFLLNQYSISRPGIEIRPHTGDVVLDCGACFGDTTLWFADRVGPRGRVVAFECQPMNRRRAMDNIESNPHLSERVTIDGRALWRESQPERLVTQWVAGSSVLDLTEFLEKAGIKATREQVAAVAIDDYVREAGLSSVNFIKMSIEGSELAALEGARQTLLSCQPQLAITAFRSDIVDIYRYVSGLDAGYRFALGHTTNHTEETVLFATASPPDGSA